MLKHVLVLLSLTAVITLAACSSGDKKPAESSAQPAAEQKKPEAAPEYSTGREAFQRLYVAARGFAPDVKPYRLQSSYTPDSPAAEGKAGIWRAQFASPSRRAIKSYTWSGLSGENMPDRGVSHSTEDTYNPSNSSTQVFDIAFLKIDSEKAFSVAQKHGGEKLTRKDPKQPVTYILDWDPKAAQLVWHVIYGKDRNESKLAVAVDATTGNFLRIEH